MKAIVYTIVLLSVGFLSNSALANTCPDGQFQCGDDGICLTMDKIDNQVCDCNPSSDSCEDEPAILNVCSKMGGYCYDSLDYSPVIKDSCFNLFRQHTTCRAGCQSAGLMCHKAYSQFDGPDCDDDCYCSPGTEVTCDTEVGLPGCYCTDNPEMEEGRQIPEDCTYAGDIRSIDGNDGFSCDMTDDEIDEKLNSKCNEVYPGSRSISYSDLVRGGYKNIINLPSEPTWTFQPSGQEVEKYGCDERGSRLCGLSGDTWSNFPQDWANHGGALLTAMCVYGECPYNKPENTCTNGILGTGSNSDVCCDSRCSKCGGVGCGTWPFGWPSGCCYSGVRATERYCDEVEPPCVIRTDKPEETSKVEDYFRDSWNGTCENPSTTGSYETCCDKACGVCGGTGCGSKDNLLDGSNDFAWQRCCKSGVNSLRRTCGPGVGYPCVIDINSVFDKGQLEYYLSDTWNGTCQNPDSKNKRCCDNDCGICTGEGCGSYENAMNQDEKFFMYERCCASGIESLGRVCGPGVGPPCVLPQTSRKMLFT